MGIEIERIAVPDDELGEGPLWDPAANVLYWVDIKGRAIHRLDVPSGAVKSWPTPSEVGALALREAGGAVVVLKDGFYAFNFASGACVPLAAGLVDAPGIRFNDAKVDRQGRLVAGTIVEDLITADGQLFRLNRDLSVEVLESGIICSNGPCWSPDGGTFYFADTPTRVISAYDYDAATGALANKRPFADTDAFDTAPDGATVDAEGYLWSAFVLTGAVGRFAPDGTLDRTIDVPVDHPTSVAFGGADLDVLYVTSLTEPLRSGDAASRPGGLHAIHGLGVQGIAEPRFAG
jgi:sugar lactone lactonase YvrE